MCSAWDAKAKLMIFNLWFIILMDQTHHELFGINQIELEIWCQSKRGRSGLNICKFGSIIKWFVSEGIGLPEIFQ